MIERKPIEPFRYFCQHAIPAVYDDSLSYYELLCKLSNKLNEIIESDNDQIEGINEIKKLHDDLKIYVDNYFKNLDLQNEIDRKLDEMGSSGDMARYISMYLGGVQMYGFRNIDEMKKSDLLGFGAVCKVLGNTDYMAGDGYYYNIRHARTDDQIDEINIISLKNTELVAEKIPYYHDDEIRKMIDNVSANLQNLTNTYNSQVGDLNNLVTNAKSNLVSAINEGYNKIDSSINTAFTNKIGDLNNLTTSNKSNIVSSINALKSSTDSVTGSISNLNIPTTNLVEGLNHLNSKNIPITQGGTGARNVTDARINLGILSPTTLFENVSGSMDTITLSQSITNFKYFEIYYKDADNAHPINSSVKFYSAPTLYLALTINNMSGNNFYSKSATILIAENTVTFTESGWFYFENGNHNSNNTPNIKIKKVIGWK